MVAADKKLVKLPRDVRIYETSDGDRPFDHWLKKQKGNRNTAVKAAFQQILQGKAVKVKSYSGNIGAIVLFWPTKLRIYYGIDQDETIVLLGGDEDGQTADLDKSRAYWSDYKSREAEEVKNVKES